MGQNRNGTTTLSIREIFPRGWRAMALTIEVEAKAKEVAVLKLKNELERQNSPSNRHAKV